MGCTLSIFPKELEQKVIWERYRMNGWARNSQPSEKKKERKKVKAPAQKKSFASPPASYFKIFWIFIRKFLLSWCFPTTEPFFISSKLDLHVHLFIRNWSIRNWGSDFDVHQISGLSIVKSFLNPTFYSKQWRAISLTKFLIKRKTCNLGWWTLNGLLLLTLALKIPKKVMKIWFRRFFGLTFPAICTFFGPC